MGTPDPARATLVVIDVQRTFDEWEAAGKRHDLDLQPHRA